METCPDTNTPVAKIRINENRTRITMSPTNIPLFLLDSTVMFVERSLKSFGD
jgi:hypothetical protein